MISRLLDDNYPVREGYLRALRAEVLTELIFPSPVAPAAVGTTRKAGSRTGVFVVASPRILLNNWGRIKIDIREEIGISLDRTQPLRFNCD